MARMCLAPVVAGLELFVIPGPTGATAFPSLCAFSDLTDNPVNWLDGLPYTSYTDDIDDSGWRTRGFACSG